MYTAYYLPLVDPSKNPTKGGFDTEEDAERYIFSKMCFACQEERHVREK